MLPVIFSIIVSWLMVNLLLRMGLYLLANRILKGMGTMQDTPIFKQYSRRDI